MTKIKFKVTGLDSGSVSMEPVQGTTGEDPQSAFPSGRLDLHILNTDVLRTFRKEKIYEVTFTPVEPEEPVEAVEAPKAVKAPAPEKAPAPRKSHDTTVAHKVKTMPAKPAKPVKVNKVVAPVKSRSKVRIAPRRK